MYLKTSFLPKSNFQIYSYGFIDQILHMTHAVFGDKIFYIKLQTLFIAQYFNPNSRSYNHYGDIPPPQWSSSDTQEYETGYFLLNCTRYFSPAIQTGLSQLELLSRSFPSSMVIIRFSMSLNIAFLATLHRCLRFQYKREGVSN